MRKAVWLTALGLLAGVPGGSAAGPFDWFNATAAPTGWKHVSLPSGAAVLSFPPSLQVIRHDVLSVSVAQRDRNGRYLAYLNITPAEGEQLATWPAFRIKRLLAGTALSAHKEAEAFGLSFRGGKGSCVIDVYTTRAKQNHYREIACFVRGTRTASVVVAAAPVDLWARFRVELQRAISAFRVVG